MEAVNTTRTGAETRMKRKCAEVTTYETGLGRELVIKMLQYVHAFMKYANDYNLTAVKAIIGYVAVEV